jgi:hypothetical protein
MRGREKMIRELNKKQEKRSSKAALVYGQTCVEISSNS